MSLPASDLTKKPDMRTTMELGAVLPETAEVRDDHLFIGGVDMVELARKEGTALYVFDEADLRHRMEAYREAFRSRYENSDIIYASKAFLNKEVVRIAEAEGLCLDVSAAASWPARGRWTSPWSACSSTATTRRPASWKRPSPPAWGASCLIPASSWPA